MAVRIKQTADGSPTLYSEQFDQHYHSVFGAKQESDRIFIDLGLLHVFSQKEGPIRIFEMGFGTGLNAWLTAAIAHNYQREIHYTAIEAYPVNNQTAAELSTHLPLFTPNFQFIDLHQSPWNIAVAFSPYFSLTKITGNLETFSTSTLFDLIYFDAFAPEVQPELWSVAIFKKMASMLLPNGTLTTYCSKSYVQRNMKESGFRVEKHVGPPHKREVIRAIKI